MASLFTRRVSSNVGNANVVVGSYIVAANTSTTLIGLVFTNTYTNEIQGSALLRNATSSVFLIKNAPIPTGSSLVVVGGEQKIVMITGDRIEVQSDTSASMDVVMSLLEIT